MAAVTKRWRVVPGPVTRLWQQLIAHRLLNGALGVGLVVLFALLAAVPTYLSVSASAILSEVAERPTDGIRPRLSYFFASDRDIEDQRWLDIEPLDRFLRQDGSADLGITISHADTKLTTRRFETVVLADGLNAERSIGPRAISAVDGALGLMEIIDGQPLGRAAVEADDPIEVLIAARMAALNELAVGDLFAILDDEVAATATARTIEAVVVGIWEPVDPTDQRWIVGPSSLVQDLLVTRTTLTGRVEPDRPPVIGQAQWYLIGSADGLSPARVDQVLRSQAQVERRVTEIVPGVSLARGPGDLFQEFSDRRDQLASTLRAYAVPGALIAGLFVVMAMGLNANQRRTELAVFRSRGIPVRSTLTFVMAEVAVVCIAATAIGAAAGLVVVAAMTRTTAFLRLDPSAADQAFWQPNQLPFFLLVVAAATVAFLQLLFLIGPARRTIVASRSRAGLAGRASVGLLANLDLIVVAVVAFLILQRLTDGTETERAALDDPWLVTMPAAGGLAVGLLVNRLLGPMAGAAAALLERTSNSSAFLGAQRMARSSYQVRGPIVLVVVSTALAAFLASLSLTMERVLIDDTYGEIGADVSIVEVKRNPADLRSADDYRRMDDVISVTQLAEREGRFGREWVAEGQLRVMAIDAPSFADTAYWQEDYANDPLRAVLSGLVDPPADRDTADAQTGGLPDGVIVSRTLAADHSVRVGDEIRFSVASGVDLDGATRWLHTDGTVVAVTDRFPRWADQTADPLIVMRLDYLQAQTGAGTSMTTLIRTGDDLDFGDVPGTFVRAAGAELDRVRANPERQGVFGILTATFVAATVLALLALGLQSLFAYRERSVELGVLRALGLRFRSLALLVAFDVVVIAATGVVVGTLVGVGFGLWLIPEVVTGLDVGSTVTGAEVAWSVIASVAGLFLAVVALLVVVVTVLLRRLELFRAIKLGETL